MSGAQKFGFKVYGKVFPTRTKCLPPSLATQLRTDTAMVRSGTPLLPAARRSRTQVRVRPRKWRSFLPAGVCPAGPVLLLSTPCRFGLFILLLLPPSTFTSSTTPNSSAKLPLLDYFRFDLLHSWHVFKQEATANQLKANIIFLYRINILNRENNKLRLLLLPLEGPRGQHVQ